MTKLSDLQRIKIVMNYYYKKGVNRENVNRIYHKIIFNKFELKSL